MPQITSCPDCTKKLRVPDDLIGKKVKCPGCTTMFVAEADEDGAPPPRPAPPGRGRSEAVTSRQEAPTRRSPRTRDADEEDDRDERPARGRRNEDDEDDRPRRRDEDEGDRRVRTRAQEDDRPARRRRDEGDEEEDDRRPRGRRDEDEEEDDRRPRRRRDGDDPTPSEQRQGWEKVRMGVNFVALSGWVGLSIFGVYMIAIGVMMLLGGSMLGALASGGPGFGGPGGGAAGGAAVAGLGGMCLVLVIAGLLGLTSTALLLTGVGLCMAVPKFYNSSMRPMAIAAFSCYAAFIGLYFLPILLVRVSPGMAFAGVMLQLTGALAGFAGHVLWMLFLRLVCLHLRDQDLAGTVITNLIVQIAAPFVAFIVMIIMAVIIGFGAASARSAGGAAASVGVGMILMIVLYGAMLLGMLGIYVWYILTLQKVRDLVDNRAARL